MSVKELIAEFQKLDPDRIVVLAKDPERNAYSELHATGVAGFNIALNSETQELGTERLTEGLVEGGLTKEDVLAGWKPACVLLP